VLLAACGAGLLLALLALRESRALTHPPGYVHPAPAGPQTPGTAHGLAYRDVLVPLGEGRQGLSAWLVPGAPGARVGVVTSHGRAADRRDFLRHLPVFHGWGAPVLLFDHREHGVSPGAGAGMALGMREAEDVRAAARALRAEVPGLERVVVVGVSLGASAALLAAAEDAGVDGVVAESPFASVPRMLDGWAARRLSRLPVPVRVPAAWGRAVAEVSRRRAGLPLLVAPEDVVARLAPRPLLLVHGGADDAIPVAHSERLRALAGPGAELLVVPGAAHGRAYDADPAAWGARVRALLERVAARGTGAAR
jgi:pimeloyl-ACP methyl ester carboxylesterase